MHMIAKMFGSRVATQSSRQLSGQQPSPASIMTRRQRSAPGEGHNGDGKRTLDLFNSKDKSKIRNRI